MMRDYGKVAPQFWIGETGRQLRALGCAVQVVALYLLTCPHASMIGLYYLPLSVLLHETGLTPEAASQAFASLASVGFAYYDAASEMVWIPEMARFQIGEALKSGDKRIKAINKDYHAVPKNPFLSAFWDKY